MLNKQTYAQQGFIMEIKIWMENFESDIHKLFYNKLYYVNLSWEVHSTVQ